MQFERAPEIEKRVRSILQNTDMPHIDPRRVICFKSMGSTARARARIWSFPRIWQQALNVLPHYIVEVISEKFNKLNYDDQTRVLIHELMHIPKTFSGALLPHTGRRKQQITRHTVEGFFKQYKSKKGNR